MARTPHLGATPHPSPTTPHPVALPGDVVESTDGDAFVALRVPADARLLRVARELVTSLGREAGLDPEAVDDLCVAVNELGALIIAADGDPYVELECSVRHGHVRLRARRAEVTQVPRMDPLARELLRRTTDGFDTRWLWGYLEVEVWRRRQRDRRREERP